MLLNFFKSLCSSHSWKLLAFWVKKRFIGYWHGGFLQLLSVLKRAQLRSISCIPFPWQTQTLQSVVGFFFLYFLDTFVRKQDPHHSVERKSHPSRYRNLFHRKNSKEIPSSLDVTLRNAIVLSFNFLNGNLTIHMTMAPWRTRTVKVYCHNTSSLPFSLIVNKSNVFLQKTVVRANEVKSPPAKPLLATHVILFTAPIETNKH